MVINKFPKSVILAGIIFMLLLSSLFVINFKDKNSNKNTNIINNKDNDTNSQSSSVTNKPSSVILREYKDGKWVELSKISISPSIPIIKWKNLLIFATSENDYPVLNTIDTNTNAFEKKELTDLKTYSIKYLYIVDDNLYISFSSYMNTGGLNVYTLPNLSRSKKVTDLSNAQIQKINDQYFIKNTNGEACSGNTEYYLLNTKSNLLEKLLNLHEDCVNGDILVGISENNFILASYSTIGNAKGYYEGFPRYIRFYKVSLTNPKEELEIVDEEALGKEVHFYYYFDILNSILIVNDEFRLINIDDKKITKLNSVPSHWKQLIESKLSKDSICFVVQDDYQKKYYESLDIYSGLLSKAPNNCGNNSNSSMDSYEILKTNLEKELELPNNLDLQFKY